jgi:hypothetical protein
MTKSFTTTRLTFKKRDTQQEVPKWPYLGYPVPPDQQQDVKSEYGGEDFYVRELKDLRDMGEGIKKPNAAILSALFVHAKMHAVPSAIRALASFYAARNVAPYEGLFTDRQLEVFASCSGEKEQKFYSKLLEQKKRGRGG